ncbi:MAG: hypothetical protein HY669_04570 [Chloroflexi bacterium]|nr:hypothetical protein [Chloroflexota bacterium]
MNRDTLENRIKHYFVQEGAEGDMSPRQWGEVLAHVRRQKQRRWPWIAAISAMPRPLAAMAVSLVLLVVVGGVSLLVVAPWRQADPGATWPLIQTEPGGVRGPAGRPAPRYFETTWTTDRNVITPGEVVTITGTLKNVWDQRIDVMVFPETATLELVDARDMVAVPLTVMPGIPDSMEPGQEVTFVAHVALDVSARLQPGRYNVGIEITFAHTPGKPQDGTTRVGQNSGILFVVVPPQWALDKTVQVGEVREVNGIAVTLEAINFTTERTTIVVLADLRGYHPATPTAPPTPFIGATPTPVPTATPVGREYSANPWYRINGGEWKEIRSRGYRETPEGIHIEWTLGPVPSDARTFDFSISRLGDLVFSPGQQVIGPWEWSVPLP